MNNSLQTIKVKRNAPGLVKVLGMKLKRRKSAQSIATTTSKAKQKHNKVVKTQMVMWGCNMVNQLGLAQSRPFITIPFHCAWNISVAQISCGLDHCALVTTEGRLFTFGSNQNGKLGLGEQGVRKPKTPTMVESLASIAIREAACGHEHTVALSASGHVYTWGLNTQGALGVGRKITVTDTPVVLEKQEAIVQVACGSHQTFILQDDGTVKAFGNNQVGQLGIQKSNSSSLFYKACKVAIEPQVIQVAAGDTHTLFLTMDRDVYAVGDNSQCQLGRLREEVPFMHQPLKVEELPAVSQVACSTYSAAVSTSGDLWMWGVVRPLGGNATPCRVSGIPSRVNSCSISASHVCAMDNSGMAWVWGQNTKGELGLGDYVDRTAPFPLVSLQEKGISEIVVGSQFSIGFAKRRESVRS